MDPTSNSEMSENAAVDAVLRTIVSFSPNNEPVPIPRLKSCLQKDAGKEILSVFECFGGFPLFLQYMPDWFSVDKEANTVCIQRTLVSTQADNNLKDVIHEKHAVDYFSGMLKRAPVNESIIDTLYAHVCVAPPGVQKYLKRHYNEKTFRNFFTHHNSFFNVELMSMPDSDNNNVGTEEPITTTGSPSIWDGPSPLADNHPSQQQQSAGSQCTDLLDHQAVEYFTGFVRSRLDQPVPDGMLVFALRNAPIRIFEYFTRHYPSPKFMQFFSDHPHIFHVNDDKSVGLLENYPSRRRPPSQELYGPLYFTNASSYQRPPLHQIRPGELTDQQPAVSMLGQQFHPRIPSALSDFAPPQQRMHQLSEKFGLTANWEPDRIPDSNAVLGDVGNLQDDDEDQMPTVTPHNQGLENNCQKYFMEMLQVAHNQHIKALPPATLLLICKGMSRKAADYFVARYADAPLAFFDRDPNVFRITKSNNVALTKPPPESSSAKKSKLPATLAIEFYTEVLRTLHANHVSMVSAELLWDFLALATNKVKQFLEDQYEQKTFWRFFSKMPAMFTLTRNRNVHLTSKAASRSVDLSDEENTTFAVVAHCQQDCKALEDIVAYIKGCASQSCPLPLSNLKHHIVSNKVSNNIKKHFEEHYADDKIIEFFEKYNNIFVVLRPMMLVWVKHTDLLLDESLEATVNGQSTFEERGLRYKEVAGAVAAVLVPKSPKPISAVINHASDLVADDISDVLAGFPGKNKMERFISFLVSCDDLFDVVKSTNVVLSCRLQSANLLSKALECCFSGICLRILGDSVMDVNLLLRRVKKITKSFFSWATESIDAFLDVLELLPDDIYFISKTQVAAIPRKVPRSQADHLANKMMETLPALATPATLHDLFAKFDVSPGILYRVLLNRPNMFCIEDKHVTALAVPENDNVVSNTVDSSDDVTKEEPQLAPKPIEWSGVGWIKTINRKENVGTISAMRSEALIELNFDLALLDNLNVGVDEKVNFVASKVNTEWRVIELSASGEDDCSSIASSSSSDNMSIFFSGSDDEMEPSSSLAVSDTTKTVINGRRQPPIDANDEVLSSTTGSDAAKSEVSGDGRDSSYDSCGERIAENENVKESSEDWEAEVQAPKATNDVPVVQTCPSANGDAIPVVVPTIKSSCESMASMSSKEFLNLDSISSSATSLVVPMTNAEGGGDCAKPGNLCLDFSFGDNLPLEVCSVCENGAILAKMKSSDTTIRLSGMHNGCEFKTGDTIWLSVSKIIPKKIPETAEREMQTISTGQIMMMNTYIYN